MQDGGKIRCLLNAETLRNPCTNERKELAAKLEELHATVKYIPDAFKSARTLPPSCMTSSALSRCAAPAEKGGFMTIAAYFVVGRKVRKL